MPHAVTSDPASPAQNGADVAMGEGPQAPAAEAAPTPTPTPTPATANVKTEPPSSPPGMAAAEDIEMADGGAEEAEGVSDGAASADVPVKTESDPKSADLKSADLKKETVDLEALFDDDDDDDEFGGAKPAEATLVSAADMLALEASDPEVMRSFYQRLFPWRYLFQWLNHSPTPTNDFAHREFAFTLQNDAYLRYQAFPGADLLRKDVLRLLPKRFEIGPVYNSNPAERKTLSNTKAFKPLAKELCFDIDLTDYDAIRTCCDKANICLRCWQFITMAIRVVDTALRDDFGFRHILWVYSGRRGAHAWVCDRAARALDDQKRRAVVGYLEVLRGGAQGGKRVNVRRPLHPHLARSLDLLRTHFQNDVLRDQDPWDTDERAEKLLALLPDRHLADALRRKWASAPGRASAAKWADIDAVAKTGAVKGLDGKALLEAKQDIVLEYTYPRLDAEVSKKLNHLLKSPFVVHPGTGRVCVPIDPRRPEAFDPLAVPTVQGLLQEIDAYQGTGERAEGDDAPEGEDKKLQDWEKTSLRPYVEQFRSFVLALMRDEKDKDVQVKREREETMDF